MKEFRTIVPLSDCSWKITHSDRIVVMGSCFSENIGEMLINNKFQVDLNSFGVLFNPASIAQSLDSLINHRVYLKKDLFVQNGLWNSFDHHGCFSSIDPTEMLRALNAGIDRSAEYLRNATYLFITFGTAWVYEYRKTEQIVANCHKVPAKEFDRYRLTVSDIVEQWKDLIVQLIGLNPCLKILFTVSPVRHWKDGAVGNQLSKSVLLLAVDQLVSFFKKERVTYFPSYEIMMDELRDYRFYADDMLHPSSLAIEYIGERFCEQFMTENTRELIRKIIRLRQRCSHRPLNNETEGYRKHVKRTFDEICDFEHQFPYVNFEKEKQMLRDHLLLVK